jgi:hypothetical protein
MEVEKASNQSFAFYQMSGPHLLCRKFLFQNIQESFTTMKKFNTRTRTTKLIGDLPYYGTV